MQGVVAASSMSKVLVVTISQGATDQQQQGVQGTASTAHTSPAASPQALASKAGTEASVLAELPAWGKHIVLPPGWCAKLSALSSCTPSGDEHGQGPVLTIWLATPLGGATAAIQTNQLLAAAAGKGDDSCIRVTAKLVGRGAGHSSRAGSPGSSSSSSQGRDGMEAGERGQQLELRARLEHVQPEDSAAAEASAVATGEGGEPSAGGGEQEGKQIVTDGSGGGGSDSRVGLQSVAFTAAHVALCAH